MHKDIKRKNNVVLPDKQELTRILETEVARDVPEEKESIHYPVFDTIVPIFEAYSIPTDIFFDDSLTIHDVVTQGAVLLNQLVAARFTEDAQPVDPKFFDDAYDYLAEEDTPEKSDIIFVFGSKTPLRAEKAAELFRKGLGSKIVVSGGNPIYSEANQSEAELYRSILIESGIPEEVIIIEDHAITFPDNVRRSLNLLDEMNIGYISIILVNSPYTQRRGWTLFKKAPSRLNKDI